MFNGGHFLLENTNKSIEWLEACWKVCETNDPKIVTTHRNDKELFDQPGILAILGGLIIGQNYGLLDSTISMVFRNPYRVQKNFQEHFAPLNKSKSSAARSLICEKWKPHCLVHPQESMNSYPDTVKQGDFIVHFVGNTKHLMEEWKDSFRFYTS